MAYGSGRAGGLPAVTYPSKSREDRADMGAPGVWHDAMVGFTVQLIFLPAAPDWLLTTDGAALPGVPSPRPTWVLTP